MTVNFNEHKEKEKGWGGNGGRQPMNEKEMAMGAVLFFFFLHRLNTDLERSREVRKIAQSCVN